MVSFYNHYAGVTDLNDIMFQVFSFLIDRVGFAYRILFRFNADVNSKHKSANFTELRTISV